MTVSRTLLLASALLVPTAQVQSQSEMGCGIGRTNHRYASAFFLDPSKPQVVIGNAFAIHAAPVTACSVDAILCGTGGVVRWRVLFATAAHVMRDVCANWTSDGPTDGAFLYVPASPPRQTNLADVPRMAITKSWCSTNSDAKNYENALYREALVNDRIFGTSLLTDAIRKTSDQYFFIGEIDIPDGDVVRPFSVGPLPKSDLSKNPASMVVRGFQNFEIQGARSMFDRVYWYESVRKEVDIPRKSATYVVEGWETLKGSSGSPVLQVFPAAEGQPLRYKAVGIVTNWSKPTCAEARDEAESLSRPKTVTDDREASNPTDLGADLVVAGPSGLVEAKANAATECLTRAEVQALMNRKETQYVPVLRFPDAVRSRFDQVELRPTGTRALADQQNRSTPQPLLRAIRALVMKAQNLPVGREWDELKESIEELASELPPHEATFLFSQIASQNKTVRGAIDSACARIEPVFEDLR